MQILSLSITFFLLIITLFGGGVKEIRDFQISLLNILCMIMVVIEIQYIVTRIQLLRAVNFDNPKVSHNVLLTRDY